jgi:hypothetical protein
MHKHTVGMPPLGLGNRDCTQRKGLRYLHADPPLGTRSRCFGPASGDVLSRMFCAWSVVALVLARLGGQAGYSSLSAAGLYGRAEQGFLRL